MWKKLLLHLCSILFVCILAGSVRNVLFWGPLFGRTCWTCPNPPLHVGELCGGCHYAVQGHQGHTVTFMLYLRRVLAVYHIGYLPRLCNVACRPNNCIIFILQYPLLHGIVTAACTPNHRTRAKIKLTTVQITGVLFTKSTHLQKPTTTTTTSMTCRNTTLSSDASRRRQRLLLHSSLTLTRNDALAKHQNTLHRTMHYRQHHHSTRHWHHINTMTLSTPTGQ